MSILFDHIGRILFLLWTAAGVLIWNAMLAGGGSWLGARVMEIDAYLGPVAWAVIAVVSVAYVWRLAIWRPYGARRRPAA